MARLDSLMRLARQAADSPLPLTALCARPAPGAAHDPFLARLWTLLVDELGMAPAFLRGEPPPDVVYCQLAGRNQELVRVNGRVFWRPIDWAEAPAARP